MQKKAVIPIYPHFPGQKSDILQFNGQYLAALLIIKSKYLGAFPAQSFPYLVLIILLLFLHLAETLQLIRIPRNGLIFVRTLFRDDRI